MAAGPLCRGFPQTLVRVMEESLLGDPQTIFVEDGSNENTGARGFRYFRARSSNADWWQGLPTSFDRKEIRRAMSGVIGVVTRKEGTRSMVKETTPGSLSTIRLDRSFVSVVFGLVTGGFSWTGHHCQKRPNLNRVALAS